MTKMLRVTREGKVSDKQPPKPKAEKPDGLRASKPLKKSVKSCSSCKEPMEYDTQVMAWRCTNCNKRDAPSTDNNPFTTPNVLEAKDWDLVVVNEHGVDTVFMYTRSLNTMVRLPLVPSGVSVTYSDHYGDAVSYEVTLGGFKRIIRKDVQ